MFYNVDMLTRGGKFAVIWLASSGQHLKDGKILAKHRRDALKVNVLKTVEDLQQYIIPNNNPNCPSKFSLYLAARLCHGTIAVHAFQVKHAVKNFCEQVYNRPRKLLRPGQELDCPTNTTAHNPNLKRCRCQKCATTLNYEEAEFGELIDNLVREETEGLRVINPDGEQENIAPLQLISEWPENDEAKFVQDLEEALLNAGTKVKDVNTITLPEQLDFIQEEQTDEDRDIFINQPGESFLSEGEDQRMLTSHLDPESEFYIGQPRGDPGPRSQPTGGQPMEVEHGHEIGRENDEEMEIENWDLDPDVVPPKSAAKGKRPGVPGEGGPSGPKKLKTTGEEGEEIQIGFPEPNDFPGLEVSLIEDLTTSNGEVVVDPDVPEEDPVVPITNEPRQAEIEIEPVNEEQLPKRRRRQRRSLMIDEETQLSVADLADQRQNYHDTMRVLDSFEDVIESPLFPRASAEHFFNRPSMFGPTRRTLGGLVTRHFYVPRNSHDLFQEDVEIPISPAPETPVEPVPSPAENGNVSGANGNIHGDEGNYGSLPDNPDEFEGLGAGALPHVPGASPFEGSALRNSNRDRTSAQFAFPSANQSTGGASNVGHSSSGTSGTVASGRQRAPVSTVPEVSEEVSTTSSRRTQQGRSKSRGTRTGATQGRSVASTSGAAADDEDYYAWLDEFAGLNVSDSEPDEAAPEPEPQPDELPELRVDVVIARIRELAEQHGNDNVTFTMLMPFALNNEHQAAQMFYFLLKLQRDGVVDLEQEMFEYPKEPGDIFIKLLLQD